MTLYVLMALTACKKKPPLSAADAPLVGVWQEANDGSVITIENLKGGAQVTSVVDYEDESFTIVRSGWQNGSYDFDYLVESTSYEVNMRVVGVTSDTIEILWSNVAPDGSEASGDETLHRLQ